MKIKLSIVLFMIGQAVYGQNPKSNTAEKFMTYLNNYQVDSLRNLITNNFQLKRTYSQYTNNKTSFLEDYVKKSKVFNGKYKIIQTTQSGQTTDFLVEDQSDYLKYLRIIYPKWKIKIEVNEQEKVESMIIDTTQNYPVYSKEVKEKDALFEQWLKQKYPNETKERLYKTTGLFIKRLKEYSKK